MNKRIVRVFMSIMLLVGISVTGCTQISFWGKGIGEPKKTEYKLRDDNVFVLGEEIELMQLTEDDEQQSVARYMVKSAKVYASPVNAGLTKEQIIRVDDQRAIMKGEDVTLEQIIESPILIIDMVITNEDQEEFNVSNFVLVEMQENLDMEVISSACYFSGGMHMEESGVDHYYHYVLAPGESAEIKLGYYLGADTYKLSDLFLADRAYAEENLIHYVELGLQGDI